MQSYNLKFAIFLFMKLSYMMIGFFYFYFHPNVTILTLFIILYTIYVLVEMSKEIRRIELIQPNIRFKTLLGKTIETPIDGADLEYLVKKQDYAFNNNKILINGRYRLSSMYWSKNEFGEIVKQLDNL